VGPQQRLCSWTQSFNTANRKVVGGSIPRWGNLSAPPDHLAVLGGWGPQEGRGGRDGIGREEMGRERERKGEKGEYF